MSWIEEQRSDSENGTHWKLRRAFLTKYEDKYPKNRLVSLSNIFSNVIFLSCKYDVNTMTLIEQFAKDLEPEVQEAKQIKVLRSTFSLPTLDSDAEDEDEDDMDDYTKLSRQVSRIKIPDPEVIPSPLPRPGFTPKKQEHAPKNSKKELNLGPGLIPMSVIKVQEKKTAAAARTDQPRRQSLKAQKSDKTEKQTGKPVTVVTSSKAKKSANGKGDKATSKEKLEDKLADQPLATEFTKKKKNKKKKSKPSTEECHDEEPVGAVISSEDLNTDLPTENVVDTSMHKQTEICQESDKLKEGRQDEHTPACSEKESENCQKSPSTEEENPEKACKSSEEQNQNSNPKMEDEIMNESAEKQCEDCQEADLDEATTTIVKETDEDN